MSPEAATFSKAAPADVAFTVTGAASVTSVKNQSSTVNVNNYTFAGGMLTILSAYLATLVNGEKTFTIVTDSGSASVTITVGD